MLEIISCILVLIIMIVLKLILNIKFKKLKELSKENSLDSLTQRLPDNEEIGRQMLKMLDNEDVKIQKSLDEKSGTSLYLVLGNKIIIANSKNFARVQTMAHECLHSIQSKKMLWFNYIFSNLYIVYTLVISAITLLGGIKNTEFQLYVIALAGLVFYIIRSYLEMDAMIKAKFFAKEYLKKTNKFNQEEIELLTKEYDYINKFGIPATNYVLSVNVLRKLFIYSLVVIIHNFL